MNKISSLYLHFPFCKHLCNYCDFFKHVLDSEDQVTKYESILKQQWIEHKKFLAQNDFEMSSLDTLYIGGGTPSLWGDKGVLFLQNMMDSGELHLSSDCEFTLEVDPDSWSKDELNKWFHLGVNRVSVGAQAADDKILKLLDRQHSKAEIDKTLKYLKEMGINFSVDFLIGIPNSEKRDIEKELRHILSYDPSHMSVYILKTRKNYPHNSSMPSDEQVADEYLQVCKFLNENGLKQYEVSNFSKVGCESKHNFNYWQYKSVGAVGANGTGLLVFPDKAIRYQWKSSAAELKKDIIEGSSLIIEKLFLEFRTSAGVEIDKYFKSESISSKLDKLYNDWASKNYLSNDSSRELIKLSSQGYLMCDSILDDIFREIDF